MSRHSQGAVCSLCNEKRATLDDELRPWWDFVKEMFPDCHLSWAWRGKDDQDRFFDEGKTRAKFPGSAHNAMRGNTPASRAFDCFQLNLQNCAVFPPGYYFQIAESLKEANAPIDWSGDWEGFKETNHFQLRIK